MTTKTVLATMAASLLAASAITSFTAVAADSDIAERVKPVGNLVVLTDSPTAAPEASAEASTAPETTANAGKATYDAACFACHGTGAAGAPIVGNLDAWASRVSKDKETLYFNAINGINTMPAKGGNAALSYDEVKAVVDYMVEQSS